jgi:hypothetical protein
VTPVALIAELRREADTLSVYAERLRAKAYGLRLLADRMEADKPSWQCKDCSEVATGADGRCASHTYKKFGGRVP